MTDFLAMPGFYKALLLYIEPITTIFPALMAWIFPGAQWFYNELIPSSNSSPHVLFTPRSSMAISQLANCYLLLGLISSFVFRAVRDALRHDPVSQERIIGASLTALALADVSHIIITFLGLPRELQYNPAAWNPMTHGNISFVIFLLAVRMSWFMGIGRTRYYYGKRIPNMQAKTL